MLKDRIPPQSMMHLTNARDTFMNDVHSNYLQSTKEHSEKSCWFRP